MLEHCFFFFFGFVFLFSPLLSKSYSPSLYADPISSEVSPSISLLPERKMCVLGRGGVVSVRFQFLRFLMGSAWLRYPPALGQPHSPGQWHILTGSAWMTCPLLCRQRCGWMKTWGYLLAEWGVRVVIPEVTASEVYKVHLKGSWLLLWATFLIRPVASVTPALTPSRSYGGLQGTRSKSYFLLTVIKMSSKKRWNMSEESWMLVLTQT